MFTDGAIWGIDSFDQWGVELGEAMAQRLAPALIGSGVPDLGGQDTSTAELVRRYRELRGRKAS